jgi:hypothetical protein
MGKNRLEAFSDGVIAIIITIMVLELKVPYDPDFRALLPLWPVFMSYVLSFIYVGIYWNKLQYACHLSGCRHAVLPALGLAALVSGCAPSVEKADEELQVRQAVLRYQFEHTAAARKYSIFCIAVSNDKIKPGPDAPAKLMHGLKDATHKVVKYSDCNVMQSDGVIDRVIERASGKPALILHVGRVTWIGKEEADVKGGYLEDGESASGNTYRMRKTDGKWRVVKDDWMWIW